YSLYRGHLCSGLACIYRLGTRSGIEKPEKGHDGFFANGARPIDMISSMVWNILRASHFWFALGQARPASLGTFQSNGCGVFHPNHWRSHAVGSFWIMGMADFCLRFHVRIHSWNSCNARRKTPLSFDGVSFNYRFHSPCSPSCGKGTLLSQMFYH